MFEREREREGGREMLLYADGKKLAPYEVCAFTLVATSLSLSLSGLFKLCFFFS